MKSLANYLLHGSNNTQPNRGMVLATNFAGSDVRSWSREFAEFRKLKPNLSRAVTHISLNLSPDDRQVSDEEFVEIAKQFKAGLGYTDDCPFLLVRHADRGHQHVHLMLSRISLTGVIPETNDFRKAEKLAVALRKEFRLKGPADKKKNDNEEIEMKTTKTDDEKRNAAILARFEEATAEADAKHAADAEPDAPSIEPVGMTNVKQDRDMRREIQTEQYQNALRDLFRVEYRFLRATQKAVTLHFKDNSRLYDSGNRVQVFDTPDPAVAAARLMDVVALKGWDSGFVVRGSDEFLRQAAIIAVRRGLQIVPLDAHQITIINAVREAEGAASSVVAAPSPSQPPRQPNPLSSMTGRGGIGQRLGDRRNENEQEEIDRGKNRPAGPRGPRF
jgi:hypothetical protein